MDQNQSSLLVIPPELAQNPSVFQSVALRSEEFVQTQRDENDTAVVRTVRKNR